MRIALIATSYPSTPESPSGHFVRAEALLRANEGHDVHVIAPSPYAGDQGVSAHAAFGESLFRWPGAAATAKKHPHRVLAGALFGIEAARRLSAIHPDKVIAHWMVPCAYPISLSSRAELEVVCHGADVRLLLALPAAAREHIVRHVVARSSLIRLVSRSLREALAASLSSNVAEAFLRKSVVVPPAVDVTSRTNPHKPQRPYAVYAGRLIADKRAHLGVDAMKETNGDIDLIVIGDGEARSSLEKSANRRVRFLGLRGRSETLGWVGGAVALLHPSAIDAAPTTVIEARALGVPVISCGAGDVARWAETDDGIVIVGPSSGEIARAIDFLV